MRIWAIGDLHLSLQGGVLKKPMTMFGESWRDHPRTIEGHWRETVGPDDLVLMPGDLSWARDLEEAEEDLEWLGRLPGAKVLIRGNHDWWITGSRRSLRDHMPPSAHLVLADAMAVGDLLLFGTRYWQDPALQFPGLENVEMAPPEQNAKLLAREVERLKLAVERAREVAASRPSGFRLTLAMLHFPPTDFRGTPTEATRILSAAGVDGCVFGHLHGPLVAPERIVVDGVPYWPVSADLIGFRPRPIAEL
jgi:predicted phosphohydrolase